MLKLLIRPRDEVHVLLPRVIPNLLDECRFFIELSHVNRPKRDIAAALCVFSYFENLFRKLGFLVHNVGEMIFLFLVSRVLDQLRIELRVIGNLNHRRIVVIV